MKLKGKVPVKKVASKPKVPTKTNSGLGMNKGVSYIAS